MLLQYPFGGNVVSLVSVRSATDAHSCGGEGGGGSDGDGAGSGHDSTMLYPVSWKALDSDST